MLFSIMGRKKLDDKEKREKPLRVLLTDEERAAIDSTATDAGYKSTARWARELMLSAVRVAKGQEDRHPKG